MFRDRKIYFKAKMLQQKQEETTHWKVYPPIKILDAALRVRVHRLLLQFYLLDAAPRVWFHVFTIYIYITRLRFGYREFQEREWQITPSSFHGNFKQVMVLV